MCGSISDGERKKDEIFSENDTNGEKTYICEVDMEGETRRVFNFISSYIFVIFFHILYMVWLEVESRN